MSGQTIVSTIIPRVMNHNIFTATRNVMMGASLCYMVETGKWWHAPIILLVPSAYTGYQSFKNRDVIASWLAANNIQLSAARNHLSAPNKPASSGGGASNGFTT